MIFITHDITDAIDIADEIIFLKEGKILQKSTILELLEKSKHSEVNDIISELKFNLESISKLFHKWMPVENNW